MQNFPAHPTPLWVFAYGSLMWNPGFEFLEQTPARLFGYHRALCIYSHVHRGTKDRPGLVLGLDRGGSCRGLAYRIDDEKSEDTLNYLRSRELVTNVYHEASLELRLDAGAHVQAVTYIVDKNHIQYAGRLPLTRQLELVCQGNGQSGPNRDYLIATARHLKDLKIRDPKLNWLESQL